MSINDDILYKIDSEIGKDKKVVELQREIERLNQEIRGLNNCIIEFHSEFCNKQAEINRLNNIINELEKNKEKQINEYEILILKIERYLNCYQYFLETQEENNKKIANIIHEFSLKDSDKE